MKPSLEQFGRQVMSGADMSLGGIALRAGLSAVEPLYAALMAGRNALYDSGLFPAHRLPRPVISVGNITAGGTGKTPVVRWLAEALRRRGLRPAVLLRGYKVGSGVVSDEQVMLDHHLNAPGARPIIPVQANPSRLLAGQGILERHGEVTHFILDDGFQHRQLQRDFDLVVISATDPFGYDHIHPRGLLREPLRGLARADAMLITRADQVGPPRLREIRRRLRQQNRDAPIYHASHVHAGLRSPDCPAGGQPDCTLDDLRRRRFFAFSGIGNPASLQRQLESIGGSFTGKRWFSDHHDYTNEDIVEVTNEAGRLGAQVIVTTEKDWVKIADFPAARQGPPIWRVELSIQFWDGAGERLLEQIMSRIAG